MISEGAAPATAGQHRSLGDDPSSRPETHTGSNDDRPRRDPRDLDVEAQIKNLLSPSSRNEPGQAGDLTFDGITSTTRATSGLGSSCQERLQTTIADYGEASSGNGGTASDKLAGTHPAIGRTNLARAGSAAHKIWGSPPRHPLDTLRQKGFGSESGGSRSGGGTTGGTNTADEITKLRASLKRAQEETARERERREVCEDQARVAYASLEAETKK